MTNMSHKGINDVMRILPLVLDTQEAVSFYHAHGGLNDAQIAYLVGFLSKEGHSNKKIRHFLGITKVYTVTHLKRAGTLLSEAELQLWCDNPERITLGHVRAVAKLPPKEREGLLRDLLAKRRSVHDFELLAKGKSPVPDVDTKRYSSRMSEVLGYPVEIIFNQYTKRGRLILDFYTVDDLEDMARKLGYIPEQDF
jgi:ParB family chromosome partitioning protein